VRGFFGTGRTSEGRPASCCRLLASMQRKNLKWLIAAGAFAIRSRSPCLRTTPGRIIHYPPQQPESPEGNRLVYNAGDRLHTLPLARCPDSRNCARAGGARIMNCGFVDLSYVQTRPLLAATAFLLWQRSLTLKLGRGSGGSFFPRVLFLDPKLIDFPRTTEAARYLFSLGLICFFVERNWEAPDGPRVAGWRWRRRIDVDAPRRLCSWQAQS